MRGSQKNKAEHELAVVMSRTVRSLIRGQRRWREMGKLSASLSDAKLAFGCDATNTTCMQGLAKTLGVKVLLWGTIRRDYRTVTLKIWGVSDQGATKMIEKRLDRRTVIKSLAKLKRGQAKKFGKELRGIAQPVVDALLKRPDRIVQFRVQTEPSGATVFINSQKMGSSPVTIPLRYGSYRLKLEANGYAPHEQTLQISAKDKSSQNWLLMPAQSNWESESTSAPTREIVRWTSLGVATIALTSTAFFFSESGQILGRTQDRLCLMRPALCGEPDTLQRSYPRLEYEKEVSAYNGQQALYYSSLGLTTVAFSVFASTFFFDWE